MAVEEKVKEILNRVLDVSEDEIQPDATLDGAFGVDSTEMVELTVAIKKALNLDMAGSDLKKTMSFNEVLEFLKSKGAQ